MNSDLLSKNENLKNYDDDSEKIEDNNLLGYDISVFYNTYNLSVLMKWIEKGKLIVPEFQRSYTWDKKQASSFIDSLLRGFPIPSLFIYEDRDTDKYLIVDGQQRLLSLHKYITGKFNKEEKPFKLIGESIHKKWVDKAFNELGDDKDKLEDTLLNITTIRQVKTDGDRTSIYIIFQRLNTGGTPLKAQEVRMAISYGELAKYIDEISNRTVFSKWSFLTTEKEKNSNNNYRIQEFLLKIFAFYFEYVNGTLSGGSMRGFLDIFFDKEKNFDNPIKKDGSLKYYSKSEFEKIYYIIENVVDELDEADLSPFGEKPMLSFAVAVLIGIVYYYINVNPSERINYSIIKKSIPKWKTKIGIQKFEELFQPRRTSLGSVKEQIEASIEFFKEVLNGKT